MRSGSGNQRLRLASDSRLRRLIRNCQAELLSSDDPLVKKTAESFVEALGILRERTEMVDLPYQVARQKYLKY